MITSDRVGQHSTSFGFAFAQPQWRIFLALAFLMGLAGCAESESPAANENAAESTAADADDAEGTSRSAIRVADQPADLFGAGGEGAGDITDRPILRAPDPDLFGGAPAETSPTPAVQTVPDGEAKRSSAISPSAGPQSPFADGAVFVDATSRTTPGTTRPVTPVVEPLAQNAEGPLLLVGGVDDPPAGGVKPKPGTGDKPQTTRDEDVVDGRYSFRKLHDPNGIGKFYMGREIAHVMGFGAAGWLDRPEREAEESLSKLLAALQLKPGMIVADIGAGSGRISIMMADKVGPEGKVIAVDVQQEMLDLLAKKLNRAKIENVELLKGTEKTTRLKPHSVDMALMVDVYHEFAFPYEMLLDITKAVKPGGRVVFVEYRMEDPDVPIKLVHKMSVAQVKKEVLQPEIPLKWKETVGTLPWQHVIIFEKLAEPQKPTE